MIKVILGILTAMGIAEVAGVSLALIRGDRSDYDRQLSDREQMEYLQEWRETRENAEHEGQ